MLQFLEQDNLPSYYQIKCHIILGAANEQNEPWENVRAANHHLNEAEKALAVAKTPYIHDPADVKRLEQLEEDIKEGWAALREYERATGSSDEEGDDGQAT